MDPAQMDDRISRMESVLQQVMDVTAQGQQDLIRIRQELANVQTGATASPPAPAVTETPVPLPREPSCFPAILLLTYHRSCLLSDPCLSDYSPGS
ncbi:unnamed protein product [Boreogadus saida]